MSAGQNPAFTVPDPGENLIKTLMIQGYEESRRKRKQVAKSLVLDEDQGMARQGRAGLRKAFERARLRFDPIFQKANLERE